MRSEGEESENNADRTADVSAKTSGAANIIGTLVLVGLPGLVVFSFLRVLWLVYGCFIVNSPGCDL